MPCYMRPFFPTTSVLLNALAASAAIDLRIDKAKPSCTGNLVVVQKVAGLSLFEPAGCLAASGAFTPDPAPCGYFQGKFDASLGCKWVFVAARGSQDAARARGRLGLLRFARRGPRRLPRLRVGSAGCAD
ncbi:MAG: hypothetical protein M1829_005005 [Trizodia sp. TS-e1964]|nr:MAG: hypothetical protein M1829_005005 [Trizodia sp. TS-e1964]